MVWERTCVVHVHTDTRFSGDDSVKIGGGDDKRSSSDDGSGAIDGKQIAGW